MKVYNCTIQIYNIQLYIATIQSWWLHNTVYHDALHPQYQKLEHRGLRPLRILPNWSATAVKIHWEKLENYTFSYIYAYIFLAPYTRPPSVLILIHSSGVVKLTTKLDWLPYTIYFTFQSHPSINSIMVLHPAPDAAHDHKISWPEDFTF